MDNQIKKYLIEKYGEELTEKHIAQTTKEEQAVKSLTEKILKEGIVEDAFKRILSRIGLTDGIEIKVWTNEKRNVISAETSNLADKIPAIAIAWEKFIISDFGGGKVNAVRKYVDGYCCDRHDISKVDYTAEPTASFTMSAEYLYKSHSGGSNGTEVAVILYDEENGLRVNFYKDGNVWR